MIETKDFSQWYLDAILKAELVDYSPVRGCMVIRPNGFAIWELIQQELDRRIKESGAKNAYFPLFIPKSFLDKEKKHIEGFSPELAIVTHAGGSKLEEPLVVRPTSETIIYHMFSQWIKSYRDLPLKINQWANVVRWEMRTRPFLRTSEFLWQEGHTAHKTEEEAQETALYHLKLYKEFYEDYLAVPALTGKKVDSEKFAGAKITYTLEPMMKDGKALQTGTSHLLNHSFPKSFDIQFQGSDEKVSSPWCTSWGTSTRMLGMIIMVHGDDKGLVIPPKAAPTQVAIIPIFKSNNKEEVLKFAQDCEKELKTVGVRTEIILDESKTPGAKFFECEQKGIPLRIEIGPRDVESQSVVVVPRVSNEIDDRGRVKKEIVSKANLEKYIINKLSDLHSLLLNNAHAFLKSNTHEASSFDQLSLELESKGGYFKVDWCEQDSCEQRLKEIKASFRVILEEDIKNDCFVCKNKAKIRVIVARAY